ncbi:hypothetical protein EKN94_19895 [Enterobacter quasimori]|uniref:Uncharacterized protein n=1 Tax=Enterobacter quasimori TaxID=2838947 RepID=A0ABY0AN32_9ENTR|nr:hypothetical protein EKN94_19895 [Enterobacter quasimori]
MPIFTSLACPAKLASRRVVQSVRDRFFIFIIIRPFCRGCVAEIKEKFTAETQQIFNVERPAGNYRFLSSHYDIWFISEFMTAIGF